MEADVARFSVELKDKEESENEEDDSMDDSFDFEKEEAEFKGMTFSEIIKLKNDIKDRIITRM